MLEFHPIADLFPLMQGDEYEALKADIAANGLRERIWLHPDGRILDGRNRYRACEELGVAWDFRTWDGEGSLTAFVVSMNLHRRHLTSSQRAVVALEILPMLEREAKEKRSQTQGRPSKKLCQGIDTVLEEKIRATQQAAKLVQTNRQYVSDAKKLRDEAPDLLEQVKEGDITIPKAKTELAYRQGDTHTMRVMGSSESSEWCTPPHIIELTQRLFGGQIDTDPCSNDKNNPNVPAVYLYTKEDDGLSQTWYGAVYMNPPYGKEIPLWVEALVEKYECGEIQEAIALLPGRIDTKWFQPLYDFLICNIRGRLNYPQSKSATPFPSVVVYLGNNESGFISIFGEIGPVLKRVNNEGI